MLAYFIHPLECVVKYSCFHSRIIDSLAQHESMEKKQTEIEAIKQKTVLTTNYSSQIFTLQFQLVLDTVF